MTTPRSGDGGARPPGGGRLAGIDLVVLDKDGTLIDFHAMWSGWATDLADRLEAALGPGLRDPLFDALGYDPDEGRARPGGRLAATPMARLREVTADVLHEAGRGDAAVATALDGAWHAPVPVALAHPLVDLPWLLAGLRAGGRRVAVATTDDREPTERTFDALRIAPLVDALACADDGLAPKPAPDMVLALCERTGVPPSRTAVVGDSVADLRMALAAGAARRFGVLTGVDGRASLEPLADEVLPDVAAILD